MIENSIVYRNMKKYNFFRMSRAEGSLIWDREGKRYIDFTSAWNVTNLGWNHPEINDAIVKQTHKNTQGLLWGSDPIQEAYAEKLTNALPKELNACTKATGGTEAIEESIKVARAATGKSKIIGFKNSYHGQLFASLALGYSEEMVARIKPLVPDFIQLDFPDKKMGKKISKSFSRHSKKSSPKTISPGLSPNRELLPAGGPPSSPTRDFSKPYANLPKNTTHSSLSMKSERDFHEPENSLASNTKTLCLI